MSVTKDKADFSKKKTKKTKKKHLKKKKNKSIDTNQCYICYDSITKKEMYYPCNCEFGFVHRDCLSKWVRRHPMCRICGLKYHLDRQNDTCFICQKDANDDELIKPCDCKHITVHHGCLNLAYQNENLRKCEYCSYEYRINTKSTIKFDREKSCYSLKIIGYLFLNLLTLLITILLILGTSMTPASNRKFKNNHKSSFLLFPGYALETFDILYLIFCGIIGLIIIFYLFIEFFSELEILAREHNAKFKLLIGRRLVWIGLILLFQLTGNLHYQFYYWVGMIPEVNHFWMFNAKSFLVGLAGLILLTLPITVPGSIGYGSYRAIKYLCFEKQTSVQIIPKDTV